jgi:hypothetical protein
VFIADGKCSPILSHFSRGIVARLLRNFLEQQPCPKEHFGLVASAYSYLFSPGVAETVPHLADKSIMMLLLLMSQAPRKEVNHFKDILATIEDLDGTFVSWLIVDICLTRTLYSSGLGEWR